MCSLASTGNDGLLTFFCVVAAIALIAVGAVLLLKGGRAAGVALAGIVLVCGMAIGSVSSPSSAQAADCPATGAQAPNTSPTSPPAMATISLSAASWTAAGVSDSTTLVVTNTSSAVSAVNLVPTLTGDVIFSVAGNSCAAVVVPMASCQVTIQFAAVPSSLGAFAATVSFAGSNTNTVTASLSGMGYTELEFDSAWMVVPEGSVKDFTVTNVGSADAQGFSVSMVLPGGSDFTRVSASSNDCAGVATLLAGESCVVSIQLLGPVAGVFTITADAANAVTPATIEVSGPPI